MSTIEIIDEIIIGIPELKTSPSESMLYVSTFVTSDLSIVVASS